MHDCKFPHASYNLLLRIHIQYATDQNICACVFDILRTKWSAGLPLPFVQHTPPLLRDGNQINIFASEVYRNTFSNMSLIYLPIHAKETSLPGSNVKSFGSMSLRAYWHKFGGFLVLIFIRVCLSSCLWVCTDHWTFIIRTRLSICCILLYGLPISLKASRFSRHQIHNILFCVVPTWSCRWIPC